MTTSKEKVRAVRLCLLAILSLAFPCTSSGADKADAYASRWKEIKTALVNGKDVNLHTLAADFPIEEPEFRSYFLQLMDGSPDADDGLVAGAILKAYDKRGMVFFETVLPGCQPLGKAALLRALQTADLRYIEYPTLLVVAAGDKSDVNWQQYRGAGEKGGEPSPFAKAEMRVCDYAYNQFCLKFGDWGPINEAVKVREMIYRGMPVAERDTRIRVLKDVWQAHSGEMQLPTCRR